MDDYNMMILDLQFTLLKNISNFHTLYGYFLCVDSPKSNHFGFLRRVMFLTLEYT
jgi:hypothetical protein